MLTAKGTRGYWRKAPRGEHNIEEANGRKSREVSRVD